MKKNFTLSLLLAAILAGMSGVTANAQVTPFEGWVEPQLSTEEAPQWYAIMSTNPAAGDGRESRFMKYDGQELVTEQYLSGLTEETVNATLLWRLEDAGNGNIYLVSCNGGLRVNVGNEVTNGSNKFITMSEAGTTLHLMTSISTGVANTVEGQYVLQDVRTESYMNVMNWTDNSYKEGLYHITLWKGDEATSSVDTRTEKYVQSAMLAMMKDKTSFVIAHRLSTIKHAAVILVMNHGDVVEQGNHETLMAKKGFYYELYNAQFAGVSDENRDDDTAESRFRQT